MKVSELKRRFIEQINQNPLSATLFSMVHDSSVYLVGSAIVGLGNIVLIPLYTRYLTADQFGLYSLIDIAILVTVTISQLGLGIAYLKQFAESERRHQQKRLFGTIVITGLITSIVGGFFVVALISSPIGEYWFELSTTEFLWSLLPIIVLENVQALSLNHLRAERRPIAFSVSSVIRLLGIVAASVWFVVIQGEGIAGVFYGRLVGDLSGVMILIVFCSGSLNLEFSWKLMRSMVRYGTPFVWSAIAIMLLDGSGRYFLNHYSSLEQVGFYSAGVKVSNVMRMLFAVPFGTAWGGLVFQIAQRENAKVIYSKISEYVIILVLLVASALSLFAPVLFRVLTTPEYFSAINVFPLLILVQVCTILQYPASTGLYVKEKTHLLIPIHTIAVALVFVLNQVLVPEIDMYGAAIAFLVAWILIITLEFILGNRYYSIDFNWKVAVFAVGIFASTYFLGRNTVSAHAVTVEDMIRRAAYLILATLAAGTWLFLDIKKHWQNSNRQIRSSQLLAEVDQTSL